MTSVEGSSGTAVVLKMPPREPGIATILVVDDEAAVRTLLVHILRDEGYYVSEAATGREALACLRMQPVDLLLTDIRLPDIDGISLIQQSFERGGRHSAVAMTGFGTVDLAVSAMKAGAADFLTKPFQPELVAATVRRLADLRRLRQENQLLKHALVQTGTVRLHALPLADFANGGRIEGPDGLTEFERGVAEGERRAAQRDGQDRERERTLVANLTQKMEAALTDLHRSVEAEVVALAFSVASKVVKEAGEQIKELVVAQVRAALVHLPEGGLVHLRVHPRDLPTVEAVRQGLKQESERPLTFVCTADPQIAPGGCVVETSSRMIDASLDQQLLRLGEALQEREAA